MPERLKNSETGSPDAPVTLLFSPARSLGVQATLLLAVTRSFASKGASIPLPSRGGVGVGSLSFPGSPRLILFFCPTEKKEITERLARCLPQMKTELITLGSCLPHPCPSPHRGGEWLAPRYSSSLPLQARLFFSPARSLGMQARLFFLLTRSLAHFLLTFYLKLNLTTAWTAASSPESVHAAAACALADVRCDHSCPHFC